MVCGAWDAGPGYPRTRSLLDALRRLPVEVVQCRVALPGGAGRDKQSLVANPLRWPGFAWRFAVAGRRVRRQVVDAIEAHRPDLILVPYPGHLIVPWIRRVFDGPIVLDLFLSVFDTVVGDRQRFRPGSILGLSLIHI